MADRLELVIRARRAVVDGSERAVAVGVRGGSVVAMGEYDAFRGPSVSLEDVSLDDDEVLLPGLVDSHVHVNDPGRTDWEGFTTATKAAAAGVFGFKCFLLHSGVDEFAPLDHAQVAQAMREIASFGGLLIVHAEDAEAVAEAPHSRHFADFLASRPREAENKAVARVIGLARETGCRVHILHVSSADTLPLIAAARRDGVRVSAETCPHYLTFTAEEVPEGATQFKCCPPVREAANRDRLWAGLRDGSLDMVVSDHSPSTADLKALDSGDFGTAWGGISSLQLGLPAVWTRARERGFAPDDGFVVDATSLHHKNPLTPYDGRRLTGVVRGTWLRGERVDIDAPPHGRLLTRTGAR